MLGEGTRSVEEMERVIRLFVKNETFSDGNLSPKESRRFIPQINGVCQRQIKKICI